MDSENRKQLFSWCNWSWIALETRYSQYFSPKFLGNCTPKLHHKCIFCISTSCLMPEHSTSIRSNKYHQRALTFLSSNHFSMWPFNFTLFQLHSYIPETISNVSYFCLEDWFYITSMAILIKLIPQIFFTSY